MKQIKAKTVAASTTAALHLLLLVFLLLMTLDKPVQQPEGGLEVLMLGNFMLEDAAAALMPDASPSTPQAGQEQAMITQDDEPTVAIPTQSQATPQQTAEQKRAEHERQVADQANRLMDAAFGKAREMANDAAQNSPGTQQGSPQGTNPAAGATRPGAGSGSFSLSGRSLGSGTLPMPAYTAKEEGIVVVDIWVAPSGKVVQTAINNQTNTYSTALREAALKAAAQAQFNKIDATDLQKGTITYEFYLR